MRNKLYALTTELAEKSPCECIMTKGNSYGELVVNKMHIELVVLEASDVFIVQTAVAALSEKNREAMLFKLMSANNLFKNTKGMTLGLDPTEELVTIQNHTVFSNLDSKSFEEFMSDFLLNTAKLMEKVKQWADECEDAKNKAQNQVSEEPSDNFMRV